MKDTFRTKLIHTKNGYYYLRQNSFAPCDWTKSPAELAGAPLGGPHNGGHQQSPTLLKTFT